MNGRPNRTQRSWDNYVGGNPIKSWESQGFYTDRGVNDRAIPEGYGTDLRTGNVVRKSLKTRVEDSQKESEWKKLQRKSALQKGLEGMRKEGPVVEDYDKQSSIA